MNTRSDRKAKHMASFIEHKIPTAFYRLEKLAIMAGKISLTIFCMLLATGLFTSTGYHSSGAENPLTTPARDLDILRNAINLYDAQNPPLTGTSLEPLFPRYLQELPKDPWGNPYLVDTRTGFICSYPALPQQTARNFSVQAQPAFLVAK